MTAVYQIYLTADQRRIALDALNDRDSKLLARLEVCGPAERAKVLKEMGDHVAMTVTLINAQPIEVEV